MSSSTNGALHWQLSTILPMVPYGAGTVAAELLFLSFRMLIKLSFNLSVVESTFQVINGKSNFLSVGAFFVVVVWFCFVLFCFFFRVCS